MVSTSRYHRAHSPRGGSMTDAASAAISRQGQCASQVPWSESGEAADVHPRPVMLSTSGRYRSDAVDVSASSPYANPFDDGDLDPVMRGAAVSRYAVWLAGRLDHLAVVQRELSGHNLGCTCGLADTSCHRTVLLDYANPHRRTTKRGPGGRVAGLTVRRPWASTLLVPEQLGGKTVENRPFSTSYRGPVLLYGGTMIDQAGVVASDRAGLDTGWHVSQQGWLGVVVLVDVHRAQQCCTPWGSQSRRRDFPLYHWVFAHPQRLAVRTWDAGGGFPGIRPVRWSVLLKSNARSAHRTTNGDGACSNGDD